MDDEHIGNINIPLDREEIERLIKANASTGNKLNLANKNLAGADLASIDLSNAILRGVNFTHADLSSAILKGANLRKANLKSAKLVEADLRHADLTSADFSGADLSHANLMGANTDGMLIDNDTIQYGVIWNIGDLRSKETATKVRIENIASTDPANIQKVAAAQLDLSNQYYENALEQSRRSFMSALVLVIVGTLLVFGAIIFSLVIGLSNLSYMSFIGGVVLDVISGLIFYLYGKASNQLTTFQISLDRVGRFLLANSVCENIEGDVKNTTRAKLVETIATSYDVDKNM